MSDMVGSISIPNTRFYLTSIDGKKWFITEYYRTAPFNPEKETYDLYKAFAEAFRENEREEQKFPEELKEAAKSAYAKGLSAGRHSHLLAPASLSEGRPGREQYVKKPIALDSEDYNIVSNIIMWERHQAASDEPSGDYVTAFYPIKVYTKSGDSYIIAAEFDDNEKGSYIYSHTPIKGNILAVPAEHLEEYQEAIGDMNAYPYYISVDSSSDAENFWASFLCGFLSLLSATSAVLLIKMQMEGANN